MGCGGVGQGGDWRCVKARGDGGGLRVLQVEGNGQGAEVPAW